MFDSMDFGPGVKSLYSDFNIKKDIPFEEQTDLLKEDLLQVCYDSGYLLDVGWYHEYDKSGSFRVFVIKDSMWDEPCSELKCRDLSTLSEYLRESIGFIQSKKNKLISLLNKSIDSAADPEEQI